MPQFRYHLDGRWFKGNTHLHSTASDGRKSIRELEDLYAQAGYDFLCLTDHWVPSQIEQPYAGNGLLWINGVELNGDDNRGVEYHFAALGDFKGIDRNQSLEQALHSVRSQGGFLILAHPFWMGLNFLDSERFPVDAVEVYNHICWQEIGKGEALAYWNHLLEKDAGMLALACDDAHFIHAPFAWHGGWVMVNTSECTRTAILAALRAGNYYSSCGPEFKEIAFREGQVQVATSPVQLIRLVGPGKRGRFLEAKVGESLSSASFAVPEAWDFAYIEIEDHQRNRAWTNTLFLPK